ncbi:cell division protein [Bordetella pertussis]|nr:cell division protein [Bordetella pertussis]
MWNDARTINLIANTLAVLAVAAMLLAGVAWVAQRPYFTLAAIEIESMPETEMHYVSTGAVRAAIAGRFGGNFFTVDLDEAREAFESVPWVRHATVRRIWPNTLRVRVEEQQPLALWNENQMINTWGEAFTANTGELADDMVLPHFTGPEGTESLVVQRYAELARWFAPLDMHVRELVLNPRYAWAVTLSNGMKLDLGRDPGADAPDPHGLPGALPFAARIQRFVQAWPVVSSRLEGRTVTQADLRYPTGFALALAPLRPSMHHIPNRNLPRNANAMTRDIKDLIVALDIGTSKVVAVVAEILPEGRFEVLGLGQHESRGMRKGVVVNIETTVNSIQRALEEAELMADCKIRDVYAGIAGSHIRSFNSSGMVAVKDKEVTATDVARVIETAKAVNIPTDQQVLHVLTQEFIVDGQEDIREPIGMSGLRLEVRVHIVTGAVSAAQNIVKCVRRCGLEVQDLILQPLASSLACLTADEKELGVVLVDIGGGTTDVAIFTGGAIRHTAVIPIAGDQITNDIAAMLRTPTPDAEEIKLRYGVAKQVLARPDEAVEVPAWAIAARARSSARPWGR